MCYWIREPSSRRGVAGEQTTDTTDRIRPRLVGAVAATLVALVAVAALLMPASTPAVSADQGAAAIAATGATRVAEPSGAVIEQTASTLDDGVPSASEVAQRTVRAGGHCDHDL